MRSATALVSAALVATVSAHTMIFGAWVNGVFQGDGRNEYIRSPANSDPVKDMTSPDLVCNVNGGTPVSKFVSAAAGDKVTLEWYHANRLDDIIDSTHVGPIITWIAPYFEDNGAAATWTKIAEAGYDAATKKWATDTLIANKGQADFVMPANILAGKYIVRQEIIALHEADTCLATAGSRGAQFYPSCVQIEVTGSGTVTPPGTFVFNNEYTCADPGILFNAFTTFTEYPIPGGALDATLSGSSSSGSSGSGSSSSSGSTSAAASAAVPTATSPAQVVAAADPKSAAPTTLTTSTATTAAATAAPVATAPAAVKGTSPGCEKRRKARSLRV